VTVRASRPWPALLLAAMLLAAACSQGSRSSVRPTVRPSPPPVVYAALGASETAGIGTADPARESFPQVLYQRLPRSAVLYNLGLPGETTAAAIQDELPAAVSGRPSLATVWFNVDDMAAGVSAADYEVRLDRIVGGLREAGTARVLIANTPRLDLLPVYLACRPNPPAGAVRCPLGGDVVLPPPNELSALVEAYNAAITRVAQRHGATVVDLAAQGATIAQHPEYVSSDGLHPSTQGAAAIAGAFADAMSRAP
jgi:acyl-CoA thioesterase-1